MFTPEFVRGWCELSPLVAVQRKGFQADMHREFLTPDEEREMPDSTLAARSLSRAIDSADSRRINETTRDFVEKLTFATADEILTMLRELLAEDWMALPPWARNLAYRLACLQRPDDPRLLREAAADLLCFGPDWDAFAEELKERAAELEQ